MKVLVGDKWKDGFLDYYRSPCEYRIQVIVWKNLEKLEGIYFIRPKRLRILWNYFLEIGLREVLYKVKSRSKEKYRNEKFVSFGLGYVIESENELCFSKGQAVVFIAPCHPKCVERLVLPEALMLPINQSDIANLRLPASMICYMSLNSNRKFEDRWWESLGGWSCYSGRSLSTDVCMNILKKVQQSIQQTNWQEAKKLIINGNFKVEDRKGLGLSSHSSNRKSAVLFGYGNYVKTAILPNMQTYLNVDCIHEIDPTQIPLDNKGCKRWDTSPDHRVEEDYDVWLIAGFHHTHAPLAIQALSHGADAVVEKPIVTSQKQLDRLLSFMEKSKGRLFGCFHKRYQIVNDLAIKDLRLEKGKPVSYHCIVYEVPLPNLHWYRWPNSKSRLISNGCHWLDHFLFLNNFDDFHSFDLVISPDGTINCSVLLENGAFFTMVLTDKGSERIGVQDYIELRANEVTVKLVNASHYISEDRDKIIQKRNLNKMHSYKSMYKNIGERIANGLEGDSLRSVKVSCELVLALENRLIEILKNNPRLQK